MQSERSLEIRLKSNDRFGEVTRPYPLNNVGNGPELAHAPDKVMNAIMNYMPSYPEINLTHTGGSMHIGAIKVLKFLGSYHIIGDPIWLG